MTVTPVDLGIVLVPLVAVIAAILARVVGPALPVHVVVFELLLGMLVGPDLLGWVQPTTVVLTIAQFGMVMLFFVAGTHVELDPLRGRPGRLAVLGWLLSLAAGGVVALLVVPPTAVGYVAVALASTAFGALVPMLRDRGELTTPFGEAVAAVGAVGEFGPLLVISLFLGGRSPVVSAAVVGVFAVIAGLVVWLAVHAPTTALHRMVRATLHDSQQFAVRGLLLVAGALVALSLILQLDMVLGAFIAGVVWRLLMRGAPEADRAAVESKLEGVAFGFLIPVFFVATGVTFDLAAFFREPLLALLVPVVAVVLLLVRGLPAALAAPPGSGPRDRAALALLGATALPIVVVATADGVAAHAMTTGLASVLVGGAVLSLLVFPPLGAAVRRSAGTRLPAGRPVGTPR
jgi:Kef-type K+ transport system membrane component KefB